MPYVWDDPAYTGLFGAARAFLRRSPAPTTRGDETDAVMYRLILHALTTALPGQGGTSPRGRSAPDGPAPIAGATERDGLQYDSTRSPPRSHQRVVGAGRPPVGTTPDRRARAPRARSEEP
jgi:hypothetical protein